MSWLIATDTEGRIHVLPGDGSWPANGHAATLPCPACEPRPVRDAPLDEPVWSHIDPTWPGADRGMVQ